MANIYQFDPEEMLLIDQVQSDEKLFRKVVTREVLGQKGRCAQQMECHGKRLRALETWRTIIAGGMIVAGTLVPVICWLLVEYVWK